MAHHQYLYTQNLAWDFYGSKCGHFRHQLFGINDKATFFDSIQILFLCHLVLLFMFQLTWFHGTIFYYLQWNHLFTLSWGLLKIVGRCQRMTKIIILVLTF
jgi:hypothetical protein